MVRVKKLISVKSLNNTKHSFFSVTGINGTRGQITGKNIKGFGNFFNTFKDKRFYYYN